LKGVVYQDLIALLTVFAQQNLLRLERTERRVELLSVDRETLRADLDALHVIVADLRKENAELREEDAGLRTDLQKIMARLDHLDKPGEVTDVHNKIAALQDRQAQDQ
jgi:predicted nuclease with TOPRIM domain